MKTGWFSFEKSFAAPSFLGYITNLDQTAGALDIPILSGWRFGISGNQLNRDRHNADCCTLGTSIFQQQYDTHISYQFPRGLNVVLSGQIFNSKDLLEYSFNFKQYWTGCNISLSRQNYNVVFSANLGLNKDLQGNQCYNNLQRYYFYLFKKIGRNLDSFLLAESGHVDFFEPKKWCDVISSGIRYSRGGGNWIELSARYSMNIPESCSFKRFACNFNYVLKNRHELYFQSEYIGCKKAPQPEKYLVMLRYSLPLNIPAESRKDRGCIKGKLLHTSTQQPISYAVVNIGGKRVVTNPEGDFSFNLPKGTYPVQLENHDGPTSYFEDRLAHIRGGKCCRQDFFLEPCADLSGRIELFDLPELYENYLKMQSSNVVDLSLLKRGGGAKDVRISISNHQKKLIFTAVSDRDGIFTFKDIPCGLWVVVAEVADIPSKYIVMNNESHVNVTEDKEVHCNISCYPIECKMFIAK